MLFNIFVTICVLAITLWHDAVLRFRYVFFPRSLKKWLPEATKAVPGMFFSIMKGFYGYRFIHENPDTPLPPRFLLIANHQSLMDIPVVFYWFSRHRIRFVAKQELGRWVPFVSQVLRYEEHCLVGRRTKRMDSMKSIEAFAHRSHRDKTSPVIFPEGTRSRDGSVKTFHSGGVRRILEISPMPVVALSMDGGWKISDIKRLFTSLKNGSYRMRIEKVYDTPSSKEETLAVLEDAHRRISKRVQEWHAQQ